jgi:hypothetical protein
VAVLPFTPGVELLETVKLETGMAEPLPDGGSFPFFFSRDE